ncbi:MAG TPA: hypothetical protein VH306_11480 [Gaiellaceae bacterium]|jgi:hypothetical protein
MAAPAPRRDHVEQAPPRLPTVERNLRSERAKRRARLEHERQRRHARHRFWFLLLFLFIAAVLLGLTILDQIRALFGI